MNASALVLMMIAHLGQPHTIDRALDRALELANVASDIASTDATETEAAELVAICIHESRCTPHAVGDGGAPGGAFQVRGRDISAIGALAKLRWSERLCGPGGLAPYAGGRRCGDVPEVVASLLDPTIPRR